MLDSKTKNIYVQIVGGGGAGGDADINTVTLVDSSVAYSIGAGGGSGCYVEKWMSKTNDTINTIVGAGGNNDDGEDSQVAMGSDTIIAYGGSKGDAVTKQLFEINDIVKDKIWGGSGGTCAVNNNSVNIGDDGIYYINGTNGFNAYIKGNNVNRTMPAITSGGNSIDINATILSFVAGNTSMPVYGETMISQDSLTTIGALFYLESLNNSKSISMQGLESAVISRNGTNGLNYGGGGGGAIVTAYCDNVGNISSPLSNIAEGGAGANGFISIIEFG
jgi:hypothetical protein